MSQDRRLLIVTGSDAESFLQGLITNDVAKLSKGLVYTALLTPQGKYLVDFFLLRHGDGVLLDVDAELADMLKMRLTMYKLRANVEISASDLHVHCGINETPKDGFVDPREARLGWRAYRAEPQSGDAVDWEALYVEAGVPRSGIELTEGSYILEMGFERLNGVDFRKGCYVGQEITARMKHKTELRKGLVRVAVSGPAEPGAEITAEGKPVGTLHSRAGNQALAYLRFDRAKGEMMAGDAKVSRLPAP